MRRHRLRGLLVRPRMDRSLSPGYAPARPVFGRVHRQRTDGWHQTDRPSQERHAYRKGGLDGPATPKSLGWIGRRCGRTAREKKRRSLAGPWRWKLEPSRCRLPWTLVQHSHILRSRGDLFFSRPDSSSGYVEHRRIDREHGRCVLDGITNHKMQPCPDRKRWQSDLLGCKSSGLDH